VNLVRFAHPAMQRENVGIMEHWNTGFWDTGAMVYWKNVPEKNIKKQEASFEKHHSNIPCIG
jgi:hypothetical protein